MKTLFLRLWNEVLDIFEVKERVVGQRNNTHWASGRRKNARADSRMPITDKNHTMQTHQNKLPFYQIKHTPKSAAST